MQTQNGTQITGISGIKRLTLGVLAGMALLGGSVAAAAQPAAAAPLNTDPYVTYNRDYTRFFRPSYSDIWTKSYTTTIPVGNYFGPSPRDEGCDADARARGYVYGETYLKNWWTRFEWNGRNFITVEVTCRAYRTAPSSPVIH